MNEMVEFCLRNMTHAPCSPTTYKTLSHITEERARICASVANVASPLIMDIHNCMTVRQFIGTPDGSECAVTGQLLNNKYGVQLKYGNAHTCVHPDVAELFYHYFTIRHFPLFMCGRVRSWLLEQPWFVGFIDARAQKITRAYWEPVMRREYEVSSKYLKSFVNTSAQKRSTVLE